MLIIIDDTAYAYIQKRPGPLVGMGAIAIKRLEPEELPKLVMYDPERFGAQRTRVLTSYYHAFPDRTFIAYNSQGTIIGYIIAQARRLGPWLADTAEIAEALLHQTLYLIFSQPPMVIIPEYNQAARSILTQAGFMPEQHWPSMHIGRIPDLQRRQWLYGYANLYVG